MLSLLGRAVAEGGLRRHAGRRGAPHRLQQHAGEGHEVHQGRLEGDAGDQLHGLAEDVHVPRRHRRRRVRLRAGQDRARRARPRLHPAGALGGRHFRLVGCDKELGHLRRLLRCAVPVAQTGHGGHSRVRHGRHGKLGLGHVPRGRPLDRPEDRLWAAEAAGVHRCHPRARAPVVRQLGDDGVVGRLVVERGLRFVVRELCCQRDLPRLQVVGPVRVGHVGRGLAAGQPEDVAPHPGADQPCRGGRGGLRRHQLLQGRLRDPHGARRPGARRLPQGPAGVHEETQVLEHRDVPLVGRVVRRLGQGREGHDVDVDGADGVSLGEGHGEQLRRQGQDQLGAVLVPGLGRGPARGEAVDGAALRPVLRRREPPRHDHLEDPRDRGAARRLGRRRLCAPQRRRPHAHARRLQPRHARAAVQGGEGGEGAARGPRVARHGRLRPRQGGAACRRRPLALPRGVLRREGLHGLGRLGAGPARAAEDAHGRRAGGHVQALPRLRGGLRVAQLGVRGPRLGGEALGWPHGRPAARVADEARLEVRRQASVGRRGPPPLRQVHRRPGGERGAAPRRVPSPGVPGRARRRRRQGARGDDGHV
mmetsp:Transcript_29888/g.85257  ORF Transcript_29888/g.85257 Transcript_29888/m.85257 type:complete len:591 (+) Transcript_29888:515-2287(+)